MVLYLLNATWPCGDVSWLLLGCTLGRPLCVCRSLRNKLARVGKSLPFFFAAAESSARDRNAEYNDKSVFRACLFVHCCLYSSSFCALFGGESQCYSSVSAAEKMHQQLCKVSINRDLASVCWILTVNLPAISTRWPRFYATMWLPRSRKDSYLVFLWTLSDELRRFWH